jgi:hypothetical protein
MSTFRLDIHKISKDLKEVDKNFKKTVLFSEITGVSHTTEVVELIYWNCKTFNHKFLEMIEKKSDLFPVFKLLKFYSDKTGKNIESVIIKD